VVHFHKTFGKTSNLDRQKEEKAESSPGIITIKKQTDKQAGIKKKLFALAGQPFSPRLRQSRL
jgi:hypothetical protein